MSNINALEIRLTQIQEEIDELSFMMVEAEGEELETLENKLEELEEEAESVQFELSNLETFVKINRE